VHVEHRSMLGLAFTSTMLQTQIRIHHLNTGSTAAHPHTAGGTLAILTKTLSVFEWKRQPANSGIQIVMQFTTSCARKLEVSIHEYQ